MKEKLKTSSVALPPSLWDIARAIGYGNVSKGIRIALIEYANSHSIPTYSDPEIKPHE